jgi:hypothetical protein
MPSTNKSYSVQAEKQENIGGVGAVSGFPGAALLSLSFVANGLSTIRSHFSIAFVSASSSISINSAQPSIFCTGYIVL